MLHPRTATPGIKCYIKSGTDLQPGGKLVADAKACFVIGPIGEESSTTRNNADTLLHYVIKAALEPSYSVTRADEISKPGDINDQVIISIKQANLIVADLHGDNPNAYYEIAIAHCFRKPTIHMIGKGANIPFDLRLYRTIYYDLANPAAHERAREDLKKHASALEAPDAEITNPVTRALGAFELAQSEDVRDQVVAELSGGLQQLLGDFRAFADSFPLWASPALRLSTLPRGFNRVEPTAAQQAALGGYYSGTGPQGPLVLRSLPPETDDQAPPGDHA
jgi:hypothetical protein